MSTQMNLSNELETTPQEMCTSVVQSDIKLGKFNSVEALLGAYNNLEKEFTRRSQLMKEMEHKLAIDTQNPQKSGLNENESNNPKDVTSGECSLGCMQKDSRASIKDEVSIVELTPTIADDTALIVDGDCDMIGNTNDETSPTVKPTVDELVDRLLEDNDIKEQIYSKLLDEVAAIKLPRAANNKGQMLLTPIKKPKSISEAGAIAEQLINTRRL